MYPDPVGGDRTGGATASAQTAYAADLRLAFELADAADAVTLGRFGALDLRVDTKPDRTPVTDADRAVEQAFRATIATERPGDTVVGEEYGDPGGSSARRWIVDPIDGTMNYVRGVPVWASLIALEVDGVVVAGVASAPALGRRWWAVRGCGAWTIATTANTATVGSEPRRCEVSSVSSLGDAFLSYSGIHEWADAGRAAGFARTCDRAWRTRGFGDFWSHVLVAEGAVDASFEPNVELWDVAPLQVIVEEAGGRCTDLTGAADPAGGSVVCSNGLLHDDLLAILTG
jgi:histidinol-phosphatase